MSLGNSIQDTLGVDEGPRRGRREQIKAVGDLWLKGGDLRATAAGLP
ncbi:hypothetical protein [Tritonibacter multivorans]|nr:hypothetical protein [Tritonibacter multivorans]